MIRSLDVVDAYVTKRPHHGRICGDVSVSNVCGAAGAVVVPVLEQDAVGPCRDALFGAGVVGIRKFVIFVRGTEVERSLRESQKGSEVCSFSQQLVVGEEDLVARCSQEGVDYRTSPVNAVVHVSHPNYAVIAITYSQRDATRAKGRVIRGR